MELVFGTTTCLYEYVQNRWGRSDPFVFALSYSDEYSNGFEELNRFQQQALEKYNRFKNEYIGYSVIDLTEWADMPVNSKLLSFLYYLLDRKLSNKRNRILFVSEKYFTNSIIKDIEDIFNEKANVVDLGVRYKEKSGIGFKVNELRGDEFVRG